MPRITKNAQERKREIIDTALELFITNGIDTTSVNDVLEKIKIAKGTFYYYFKSKDELVEETLSAISEIYVQRVFENINSDWSASNQIEKFIDNVIKVDNEGRKIVEYVHRPENLKLHTLISRKFSDIFYKKLLTVIQKGQKEGDFNIKYVDKTLFVLLNFLFYSSHDCICEEHFSFNDWTKDEVEYFVNLILKTNEKSHIKINRDFFWRSE